MKMAESKALLLFPGLSETGSIRIQDYKISSTRRSPRRRKLQTSQRSQSHQVPKEVHTEILRRPRSIKYPRSLT